MFKQGLDIDQPSVVFDFASKNLYFCISIASKRLPRIAEIDHVKIVFSYMLVI